MPLSDKFPIKKEKVVRKEVSSPKLSMYRHGNSSLWRLILLCLLVQRASSQGAEILLNSAAFRIYSIQELGNANLVYAPDGRLGTINNRGECLVGDKVWLPTTAYGLPPGWTDLGSQGLNARAGIDDAGRIAIEDRTDLNRRGLWTEGVVEFFPRRPQQRDFLDPVRLLKDGRVLGLYNRVVGGSDLPPFVGGIFPEEEFPAVWNNGRTIILDTIGSPGQYPFPLSHLTMEPFKGVPLDASASGIAVGINYGPSVGERRFAIWYGQQLNLVPTNQGPVVVEPNLGIGTLGPLALVNDQGQAIFGPRAYVGSQPRDYWIYLHEPLAQLPIGLHRITSLNTNDGILSQVHAINNRSEIVGVKAAGTIGAGKGIVWDLTEAAPRLLDSLSGNPLSSSAWPLDINDRGQILAVNRNGNESRTLPTLANTPTYLMSPTLSSGARIDLVTDPAGTYMRLLISATNVGQSALQGLSTNLLLGNLVAQSQIVPLTPEASSNATRQTLLPGAHTTLSFRYRLSSSYFGNPGNLRFILSATNSQGVAAISTLQQLAFRFNNLLLAEVSTLTNRIAAGEELAVRVRVVNGTTNTLTGVRLDGLPTFSGRGGGNWVSNAAASLSVTLAPRTDIIFTNFFVGTNDGSVVFSAQVSGTDPVLGRLTTTASSSKVTIVPRGDLLIKAGDESDSAFRGQGLFQRIAAGPQVKTKALMEKETARFEIRIRNDDRKPRRFLLLANSVPNLSGQVRQFLNSNEINAPFTNGMTLSLPELAPGTYHTLGLAVTPTNAAVGDRFQINYFLGVPDAPEETLDAVQAVAEIAGEITVNSTGDEPDADSSDNVPDVNLTKPGLQTTLRSAIQFANGRSGRSIIRFQIPNTDPKYRGGNPLIEPRAGLPIVSVPIEIDGWSQNPGASAPVVELNGGLIPPPVRDLAERLEVDDFDVWPDHPDATHGIALHTTNSMIKGLVINQFPLFGVEIRGDENRLQGCYIGMDRNGKTPRANGSALELDGNGAGAEKYIFGGGIIVRGVANWIGGSLPRQGNLISSAGNNYFSRRLTLAGTVVGGPAILIREGLGNIIEGNFIGTDSTGANPNGVASAAAGWRAWQGIAVHGDANQVGGTTRASANIVIGTYAGISAAGDNNFIQGNRLGLNIAGVPFVDAAGRVQELFGSGIEVIGQRNMIGGTEPGAGNIVGRCVTVQVGAIAVDGQRNFIQGNKVGVAEDGTTPASNSGFGISLDQASDNRIVTNTVANNSLGGIRLGSRSSQSVARNNVVYLNQIHNNGPISGGFSSPIPGLAGVYVSQGSSQNWITSNRIVDNGVENIALEARADEPQPPGNLGMPAPQIDHLIAPPVIVGAGVRIAASLNEVERSATYRFEFYASRSAASGWGGSGAGYPRPGQGERFIAETLATSDFSGRVTVSVTSATPVAAGDYITATVTDPAGNTSALSPAVMVQGAIDADRDAISDAVEGKVPARTPSLAGVTSTTGDGNGDGVADAQQAQVTSFPGTTGIWMTLAVRAGASIAVRGPSELPAISSGVDAFAFPLGLFLTTISNLPAGGTLVLTNIVHGEIAFDMVFAYAVAPGQSQPGWHALGSSRNGNEVRLTLVDGALGDYDQTANGRITLVYGFASRLPEAPKLSLLEHTVSPFQRVTVSSPSGFVATVTNPIPVTTTVLAWPAWATNYQLEYTDALSALPLWRIRQGYPLVSGANLVITNVSASSTEFYRLRLR